MSNKIDTKTAKSISDYIKIIEDFNPRQIKMIAPFILEVKAMILKKVR